MKNITQFASLSTLLASSFMLQACGEAQTESSSQDHGNIEFRATPLGNDELADACYTLSARNGAGELLWRVDNACASEFGGSAGNLQYVGFCDASDPVIASTSITLELDSIFDAGGLIDPASYINPCPVGSEECSVTTTCEANADVVANFPVTILATGNKGFVDKDISIDAVTCSAKLDCIAAGTNGLNLKDDTGAAMNTVIVALNCETDECVDSHMYFNDVVISCDQDADGTNDIIVAIDPSAGPGVVTLSSEEQNIVRRAAIYAQTATDGRARSQVLALGLHPSDARNCVLQTKATTSQLPLPGSSTPEDAVYPHIDWHVPLTDVSGALSCSENALNAEGSGVTTLYTGLGHANSESFKYEIVNSCEPATHSDDPVFQGNGHRYRLVLAPQGIGWHDAHAAAEAIGGHLVTIQSSEENEFIWALVAAEPMATTQNSAGFTVGPWLGAYQEAGAAEPAGGWRWVNDEPFAYTSWMAQDPQPNDAAGIEDHMVYLSYNDVGPYWGDYPAAPSGEGWQAYVVSYVVEWSDE